MALGVPTPAMDDAAVARLVRELRVHWGQLSSNPTFFSAPGGANNRTHLVLRDPSGLTIGLKGAERGVVFGSEKEIVASAVSQALSLPLAPRSHLIPALPGGFGELTKEIVATEWYPDVEALDKPLPVDINSKVKAAAADFLNCYGGWLAFGLAIATQDRHSGNWICAADGKTVGMIDLEDSFGPASQPRQFTIPLTQFGLLDLLRAEPLARDGGLRSAIESGLRTFHERWFSSSDPIGSVLNQYAWCSGYTNEWWKNDQDTFVTQVLSELLA